MERVSRVLAEKLVLGLGPMFAQVLDGGGVEVR